MSNPQEVAANLARDVWTMTANIGASVNPPDFPGQWSDLAPDEKKAVLTALVERGTVSPSFAQFARFSDFKNTVDAYEVFTEVFRHARDARLMHTDRTQNFKESEPFIRATT